MRFSLPKREPREPDPPGVIPAWLPVQLKALSWLATAGVFYVLWLFSLNAAKDAAAALQITRAGTWHGELMFWFPVVAGYLLIALVVAWTGKVAIPAFVSLTWKENAWPKAWMLFIVLAVSAVIIAGSITVQTETRFEGNRDAAVKVEQVGAGRAALEAQKAQAEKELADMMNNRNAYLAQAASVGAVEWQKSYIDPLAENDPQRDRIIRALGAARAADAKREEIRTLTAQIAAAPTTASVAKRVTVGEADNAMANFVDWLSSIRSILLAILQDVACLLLPWIAMRTEQARQRQLAALAPQVATVDESFMIPDLRAQAPVTPQPMEPVMEAYDENGERLVFRKGHFAKKAKRGKAKETDKPVPLSDTDPRVVRPLEAQDAAVSDQGMAHETDVARAARSGLVSGVSSRAPELDAGISADGGSTSGGYEDDGRKADGGNVVQPASIEPSVQSAETQDLIAPPLSQEQAQELVDTGEYEWRGNGEDRWIERIQREAQQGAADEIVLADGQGVMKTEGAN